MAPPRAPCVWVKRDWALSRSHTTLLCGLGLASSPLCHSSLLPAWPERDGVGQKSSAPGQGEDTRLVLKGGWQGQPLKMGTSQTRRAQKQETSLTRTAWCCPLVAMGGMVGARAHCPSALIHSPSQRPIQKRRQDPNPL